MAAGQKVRVLIVDDIAETRENVRKLLQFEADIEVAGVAKSGKEGIELSQEYDPDVVLMDINMPDMDGISATEAILRKLPHVQVIILSVQGDQNYMRRAMLAGARDFLTKPPMADELISAIRRAGEMAQKERTKLVQSRNVSASTAAPAASGFSLTQGKVITIYSPKGGTGCTTIAVNLALALHNEDTRVTLVDGNFQYGDVAVFVNEQGKNTIVDIATRVDELDPDIVESVMINHAASGVHILAAPSRPEYAEKVNGDQFSQLIDYLRQMYAYVVIDTTPILTDITLAAIDKSDVIVLVTTQDIPSIKNARLFLDLLQTIGIERERIVFTMNRFDKRIAITPERVGDNLKQRVAAVIPLDERVVVPAVNRGVPFILDNKTQPSARGILSLAESVRETLASTELDKTEAMK
ncbi:MAG: response regulator [Anaerolineales bacterium]|nr:response regulator [Anaerolineales bacterium]